MSPIPLGILAVAGAGGPASDFELIVTTTISSSVADVGFTNLNTYTDYKHLQIRGVVQSGGTSGLGSLTMRFNYNTDTNRYRRMFNSGGSVGSTQGSGDQIFDYPSSLSPNDFAPFIIDIWDFSSSSKTTVARSINGFYDSWTGGDSRAAISSRLWPNTATLTSIDFYGGGSVSIGAGSRFSLYGIKG